MEKRRETLPGKSQSPRAECEQCAMRYIGLRAVRSPVRDAIYFLCTSNGIETETPRSRDSLGAHKAKWFPSPGFAFNRANLPTPFSFGKSLNRMIARKVLLYVVRMREPPRIVFRWISYTTAFHGRTSLRILTLDAVGAAYLCGECGDQSA